MKAHRAPKGLSLGEKILFYSRRDAATGCWLWTAALNNCGYGVVQKAPGEGRIQKAHRASYVSFVGPIPDGLHIDHLCNVRSCVNPAHLEPVTQAENNRRSAVRRRALKAAALAEAAA